MWLGNCINEIQHYDAYCDIVNIQDCLDTNQKLWKYSTMYIHIHILSCYTHTRIHIPNKLSLSMSTSPARSCTFVRLEHKLWSQAHQLLCTVCWRRTLQPTMCTVVIALSHVIWSQWIITRGVWGLLMRNKFPARYNMGWGRIRIMSMIWKGGLKTLEIPWGRARSSGVNTEMWVPVLLSSSIHVIASLF